MKKIVLSSLLLLGMTGAAFAQGTTDFATLDADMSGGVSLAEAQVGWPDLTAEAFAAADTDANGELSPEEYGLLTDAAATAN
ncbi:hypothetical protein VW35_10620 [Devosia soli]|uniref:EF-hand domain-containing protein n=1 Tax=Devosia soli TaxID=361041 RepID=A0A0F5L940_9HYPH|nr:hypothetical protein [Devosia soli]KKB78916.1 hypothetical protein VW35_10620 [Devosia soli]